MKKIEPKNAHTSHDPRDVCEFHLGYNEAKTHYQLVIASGVKLNTELVLLALQMFIDESRSREVDLFNMGDDFILVEN